MKGSNAAHLFWPSLISEDQLILNLSRHILQNSCSQEKKQQILERETESISQKGLQLI